MGKHSLKSKSSKEDEMDEYDNDDIDELYRPYLIHSTTYALLTEQILSLMPSERNVLLTMNEYELSEINPMHPNDDDSPTHIIIFCIRFIAADLFQPVGGLLTYKHKDQSAILAECLKAYINDLWKLGLHVVGTVSPPFESFKGMLSHLVDVKDFKTYSDCLVYSVSPIKEIVHIYDIQFLLIKLQNLFKEGDVKFEEGAREYRACWNDISTVLNLSSEFKILSNYLSDNKDVSRRVHIFTQQIFEQLLELEARGILSENAGGSAVLLNCIRSFLQFTELDVVDLNLMCKVDGWDSFTGILPTMTFRKSKKRTCTKTKPTVIRELVNPSIRRKIDFLAEENSEDVERLAEDVEDLLLMDESEENTSEKLENCRKDQGGSKPVSNKKNVRRSDGRHGKQKKGKVKEAKDANLDETKTSDNDGSGKTRSHSKKPHDKQKFGKTTSKKANISAENEKTDTKHIIRGDVENDPVENKLNETEDLENVSRKKSNKNHNKAHLVCDIDKNNNNEGSYVFRGENECDTKNKRNRLELEDEHFDIVINDAQKFFESFLINHNNSSSTFAPPNTENAIPNNLRTAERPPDDFVPDRGAAADDEANYNDFCSQTDEETENCVTEICDKVPNIVEALCNEDLTDEFEPNDVTCEMLCTVLGTKKLMENLLRRRVKVAKPDAFVVEHVDFLVTIIKRDKNKINPVYYYGHNYCFLNSELAFSTLQNNTGLFLVKT